MVKQGLWAGMLEDGCGRRGLWKSVLPFFFVHLDYFIIFSVALLFCCVCEYRFVISVYFLFFNRLDLLEQFYIHSKIKQKLQSWGARLAHSVQHVTLDLRVMSSSPILCVEPT